MIIAANLTIGTGQSWAMGKCNGGYSDSANVHKMRSNRACSQQSLIGAEILLVEMDLDYPTAYSCSGI
jgi:hypothetical protein